MINHISIKRILIATGINIIVVFILTLIVVFLLKGRQAISNRYITAPSTQTERNNTLKNWKNYSNEEYKFSFKYPRQLNVTRTTNPFYELKLTVGKNVLAYILPTEKSRNLFLEKTSDNFELKKLGNNTWKYYIGESYCDAGNCGATYPGYIYKESVNYNYEVVLANENSKKLIEDIISTFKFL